MPRTAGRPRSFDRDSALDKAILVFWRHGYEATSIRDLTAELGVSAPSLYLAFGDKQQLFDEAIRTYDVRYGGFIERAIEQEPTGRAAALRMLREAPDRYTRSGLPAGCLIATGDSAIGDGIAGASLVSIRRAKQRALAGKLRADSATERRSGAASPETLAQFTFGVMAGMAQSAKDGASRAALRRVAAVAARAFDAAAVS
ncbi:TetR/AcrR family transcriptional regulator [Nakamurella aerolata]|uniref:TetR/AcrR family transcriptional regulator n=1 Tax=Nakamurella aerolata TaxID=1656892 RepID=A0A849A973_9ACTN|nr:TetR/AcrR family transcriptional regulator [Nakamurella aerolata]NNG35648.1 TetR/AcrR family transcriptional regulator [Nakamurella aerolata]